MSQVVWYYQNFANDMKISTNRIRNIENPSRDHEYEHDDFEMICLARMELRLSISMLVSTVMIMIFQIHIAR